MRIIDDIKISCYTTLVSHLSRFFLEVHAYQLDSTSRITSITHYSLNVRVDQVDIRLEGRLTLWRTFC